MSKTNFVIKIPSDEQTIFLSILHEFAEDVEVKRVSTWRSPEITYADILLTLVSAGSLTALASIVKAYLARTRGKIEIVSGKTGMKTSFEGPLDKLPFEQLQNLLEASVSSTSIKEGETPESKQPSSQANQISGSDSEISHSLDSAQTASQIQVVTPESTAIRKRLQHSDQIREEIQESSKNENRDSEDV